MPGVPSGKGCEACRNLKKKCDQRAPSCTRCLRLGIKCMGAGEQRFKFVNDTKSTRRSEDSAPAHSRHPLRYLKSQRGTMSRTPSNEMTRLILALTNHFQNNSDIRFQLVYTYGDFLEEIPRRLGVNKALDTSVDALMCAHSNLACDRPDRHHEALLKYTTALTALRLTLDDPLQAWRPETLCACYLLLIGQSFITSTFQQIAKHTEGAAQILKARGYFHSDDPFEKKLLLSLRGPVLMESLLFDNIQFSKEEWMNLVMGTCDSTTLAGRIMTYWAAMPDLMRRGKQALLGCDDIEEVRIIARQHYQELQSDVCRCRKLYEQHAVPIGSADHSTRREMLYWNFQRLYGLVLMLCLALSRIVEAVDGLHTDVRADADEMRRQVLTLVSEAVGFRPLGASGAMLWLMGAWWTVEDEVSRNMIEQTMAEFMTDYPQVCEKHVMRQFLEQSLRRLQLVD